MAKSKTAAERRKAPLNTPSDLGSNARRDISGALNAILADTFALYLKTKNFHWHVSGPHFRDYHLMFDEQAAELLASTDELAERVRKIGGNTLRSIGDIARHQTLEDNDKPYVSPDDMLTELREDNQKAVKAMREAHKLCDDHDDIGSASLLEDFIDQGEKRIWFLFETARKGAPSGH
jgi:starvation-inducible DNA-binding protein